MGVAKTQEAATIKTTTNGMGLTPSPVAVVTAIGNISAAAAYREELGQQ